ncbi:MAG: hypothetical protein OXF62_16935 [Caldilineaceae bacterium]|nr:hypothetical protein [Caldilineaceae bacterium]MCY4119283.1 hypothetical protein [Caldilineaceae bacterium]
MTESLDGQGIIDIGSRRELLVDDHLIASISRDAALRLHRPVPQEIALVTDAPWEGNASGYYTVFQDDGAYRMYYRGWHFTHDSGSLEYPHYEVVCLAESSDGITWSRPELGLVEYEGSRRNNIIIDARDDSSPAINFVPFKDPNPNAADDTRYKALANNRGYKGLFALGSPDGLHWNLLRDEPVITKGYFDSQNLAFWDGERGEYRDYHRDFRHGRDILTCVSSDFLDWTEPVWVDYRPGRIAELYTNQIIPYFRAPHIFVGFPTRYVDRPWSAAIDDLPERAHRRIRADAQERYGAALTDGLFMSSRDALTFNIWPEAYIRPGLRPVDNWTYGDNYQNWGLVTTRSPIAGAPDELSIYVNEGYWRGQSASLRRYTMRVDGFVSLNAPLSGGEMVTKPLSFKGRDLELNFSASAAGSVRVEILHAQVDTAIEGFGLADCVEILGDDLERKVRWEPGVDLSKLSGEAVRLRFVLHDADLFAYRFV